MHGAVGVVREAKACAVKARRMQCRNARFRLSHTPATPKHSAPTASESIRERFVADHRRLETILQHLIDAFEANAHQEIQKLWADFEPSLLVHLEAEEKYLIPALLVSREKDARRLLAEHAEIRAQLAELGPGVDLHMVRLETARRLAQGLNAHAHFEDGIYGWADLSLAQPERASLLSAILHAVRAAARGQ